MGGGEEDEARSKQSRSTAAKCPVSLDRFRAQPQAAKAAASTEITGTMITPDSRSYVCEYARTLSDLYLVKDVK
jgi:hypothetical protein